MTEPTGTLMWTMHDQPSRRAPSAYSTDCYIVQLIDQWVVLVIRGPETVASEIWDSEANAELRASQLHAVFRQAS